MTPRDKDDSTERTKEMVERVTGIDTQEAVNKAREVGERVQSGISEVTRQVRSRTGGFNEATIPNAFRNVPKVISPGVHRWLDIAVTGYFTVLGIVSAIRGRGGPATAAFINAGMVAGVSALTDYEGTGEKPISFKLHGTLDAVQAATAALGPVLHGFAGEGEAAFFFGQAANELGVIATTDWDAGMPVVSRRRAA
ncbi:MAG: hypothetical protein JOZ80_09480 [Acidobacteriaceae bacterium]|nr:hypothetical protein [Acidobacteriaceae bacterium]